MTRIGIRARVFDVSSRSSSKDTFFGGVVTDCFRTVGLTGFITSMVSGWTGLLVVMDSGDQAGFKSSLNEVR